ncbi:MAG: hypothetical protein ACLFQK_02180 [Fibrobacterota bacterium]
MDLVSVGVLAASLRYDINRFPMHGEISREEWAEKTGVSVPPFHGWYVWPDGCTDPKKVMYFRKLNEVYDYLLKKAREMADFYYDNKESN